ncbi:MAG: putative zinc-binding protein [Pseudomonadota bacterium]
MTRDCGAAGGDIMILPCSGGSNTGQMANQAAVELTGEGFGKMYCLAGIGGRLPGFVQAAQDAGRMIVIDGCEIGCGKATLENAGVGLKNHLVVTELGLEKNTNLDLDRAGVDLVKEAVRMAFNRPVSPSALPRLSGAGGCNCRG